MPGDEDIRLIAQALEKIHQDLREEPADLDRMLSKVAEGMKLYRTFKKHLSGSGFGVNALARDAAGSLKERPFDWEALDA